MSEKRNSRLLGKITVVVVISCLVMGSFVVNTAMALDGSGTQEDPWRIKSLEDFNDFAANANYWAGFTRLETDVNLVGRTYTTAVIAPDMNDVYPFQGTVFSGVFDGNDHNIMNLTIDGGGNYYLGLFGYIDDGEVSNLGLEGGSVSGKNNVGSLVGWNYYGSVTNCYSTGSVSGYNEVGGLVGVNSLYGSVTNCYSTGHVSGNSYVGCLVGSNHASVTNCYSTGSVSGVSYVGGLVGINCYGSVSNCYSNGDISGGFYVGGLVGYNWEGFVLECYSKGSVSGERIVGGLVGDNNGSISNCFSTGRVDGNDFVGGLVGDAGSDSNCFWDIETSGQATSDGGTGKTTAQMRTASTFTSAGWDFVNIWWILEGVGYPRHLWEVPVLHAEPEVTLGTSNTISWEIVPGAMGYYAECAEDADFTSIIYNTGWITETSYEFAGLELGKRYWYSVKARNSAGIESQWSNVESSLQCSLSDAIDLMLDPNNLKSQNLKKPYINKINIAQVMIDSGNFTGALRKLENDILQKTDGCAERGEPDKSDWIITCEQQAVVYPLIIEIIEYVKSLME